jgi:site-specific DNA recombinase
MLAIYCRTSNNKTERFSIDTQKEEGIRCAQRLGLNYKIYDTDVGVSGTMDDSVRIGLSELFKDMKSNKITHVYCIDQSRIERNTRTWEFFVAMCINNNVEYYPGGEFYDLKLPSNILFARLMSLVNSYYAEITSAKVRKANAIKAAAGKTHGLIAYGYKRGEKNTFQIDEEEAKQVRRMFDLSLSGVGAYSIANILNAEKIPTKFGKNFTGTITRTDKYTKKTSTYEKSNILWRGNVISDILRNKIYKGIREWQSYTDEYDFEGEKLIKRKKLDEIIIFSKVPMIISPELWDAVNENLVNNKKNVGRKARYSYLLNGLVFCAHCGKEVLGKKRPKGRDNAYKCRGKRSPHKDCPESRGISLPKLDTFIIKLLFESKDLKQMLINSPKKASIEEQLIEELNKLKKDFSDTEKTIDRLKKITKKLDTREEDLNSFIEDLNREVAKKKRIKNEIEILEEKYTEATNEFRNENTRKIIEKYTKNIDFEQVKKLVHALIEKITLRHEKKLKTGYYIIQVDFKNYDESSIFITKWSANKYNWVSRYRQAATNEIELEEDRENEKALMDFFGISEDDRQKYIDEKIIIAESDRELFEKSNPFGENYVGREVYELKFQSIEFRMDELIIF